MVTAVEAAGGNARLTAYPGVGHDSHTRTYADPELYQVVPEAQKPVKV